MISNKKKRFTCFWYLENPVEFFCVIGRKFKITTKKLQKHIYFCSVTDVSKKYFLRSVLYLTIPAFIQHIQKYLPWIEIPIQIHKSILRDASIGKKKSYAFLFHISPFFISFSKNQRAGY